MISSVWYWYSFNGLSAPERCVLCLYIAVHSHVQMTLKVTAGCLGVFWGEAHGWTTFGEDILTILPWTLLFVLFQQITHMYIIGINNLGTSNLRWFSGVKKSRHQIFHPTPTAKGLEDHLEDFEYGIFRWMKTVVFKRACFLDITVFGCFLGRGKYCTLVKYLVIVHPDSDMMILCNAGILWLCRFFNRG